MIMVIRPVLELIRHFNEFISDKPENIAHLPVGSAFIIKQ